MIVLSSNIQYLAYYTANDNQILAVINWKIVYCRLLKLNHALDRPSFDAQTLLELLLVAFHNQPQASTRQGASTKTKIELALQYNG